LVGISAKNQPKSDEKAKLDSAFILFLNNNNNNK
jgi:hypothetical protein